MWLLLALLALAKAHTGVESTVSRPIVRVAVVPLGLLPCGHAESADVYHWLEHLPHEIAARGVARGPGGYVPAPLLAHNSTLIVTTVLDVSPHVAARVEEWLWSALVYTGRDPSRRHTFCVDGNAFTALLQSIIPPYVAAPFHHTLFLLQTRTVARLTARLSSELETQRNSGVTYGFAGACVGSGEKDPLGERGQVEAGPSAPVHSGHASGSERSGDERGSPRPHSVLDLTEVTADWAYSSASMPREPFYPPAHPTPPTALTSSWGSAEGSYAVDFAAGPFAWGSDRSFHRPLRTMGTQAGAACVDTAAAVALLSSFLHQIALPPTLTQPAPTLPDRVMYRLFIVQQNGTGSADVNATALRSALTAVRLPGQEVFLSAHTVSMEDDSVLAVAVAASLRHVSVGHVSPQGILQSRYAPYLDSNTLGSLLQSYSQDMTGGPSAQAVATLHVPILVFCGSVGAGVLVDGQYVARPTHGVIVATQSRTAPHPSGIVVNDNELYWDLNDPTNSIVVAALELVYGVLPPTLALAEHGEVIKEEWAWAAGASVYSPLGASLHSGQGITTAVYRSASTLAVTAAADALEACSAALAAGAAAANLHSLSASVTGRRTVLLQQLNHVMSEPSADRVAHLRSLLQTAKGLQAKCEDLAAAAAAYVCESRRQARTPTLSSRLSALALWFFEAVGVVGVCVALWAAIAPCVLWCMRYRARRPPLFDPTKTKIN